MGVVEGGRGGGGRVGFGSQKKSHSPLCTCLVSYQPHVSDTVTLYLSHTWRRCHICVPTKSLGHSAPPRLCGKTVQELWSLADVRGKAI